MAKKKKEKDPTVKDTTESEAPSAPTKSGGRLDWRLFLLAVAGLACALAFLPSSLLLFFGLMPTFAALLVDPTPDRIKTMTVACMNVAGIVPFLLELWTSGQAQDIMKAFEIIARAETLITMYGAAAGGYLLFYGVTSLVATVMLNNGRGRLEAVSKRMIELERKWGREVTGQIPLDDRGFPIDEFAPQEER